MNLFLRLLVTFIRASLSREKPGFLDTTRIRSRVMLTDQDMFAHMTNSRYFSFSDLAVINYIVRTGAWPKLRRKGWFPVVAAETVVFASMLRAHQAFEVTTRLVGWTDTFICIEHRFLRDGTETARVRLIARFASRKNERVSVDQVRDLLGITDASPPLDEAFLALLADVESARARRREAVKQR